MTSSPHIKLASHGSKQLQEAARLHSICLPETITSTRGAQVLHFSYQHLARTGHSIYVLIEDGRVIGGLVVLAHNRKYSSLTLLLYRPASWIRALRQLGWTDFVAKILDLLQVRKRARLLRDHDYIIALYIDEAKRRHGFADQLLEKAISDSLARGVGVAVDTDSSNSASRALYVSRGFAEYGRTTRSVIFFRSSE